MTNDKPNMAHAVQYEAWTPKRTMWRPVTYRVACVMIGIAIGWGIAQAVG